MPEVRKSNVELDAAEIAYVEQQLARGRYRSASEVVSAGLAALRAQDAEVERLRKAVGPAYDAMVADPSRGIPADVVFAELEELLRDPEVDAAR